MRSERYCCDEGWGEGREVRRVGYLVKCVLCDTRGLVLKRLPDSTKFLIDISVPSVRPELLLTGP